VFEALLEGADGGVGARAGGGGGPGAAPSPNPSSARRAARSRLLPLSAPPSAREGVPYPLPSWDAGHSPRPDRLAAYARYVRAWSLLETLAEAQYVPRRDLIARIFAGCPHELGLFVEAELISTINVVGAAVTHDDAHAPGSAPLEFVLPGSYVTAASPRMRAAFRSLVCDPQLQLAARRLRSALHIARLREREALLLRRVGSFALIAHQTRSTRSDQLLFQQLAGAALRVEAVPRTLHHPAFSADIIAILRITAGAGGAAEEF